MHADCAVITLAVVSLHGFRCATAYLASVVLFCATDYSSAILFGSFCWGVGVREDEIPPPSNGDHGDLCKGITMNACL